VEASLTGHIGFLHPAYKFRPETVTRLLEMAWSYQFSEALQGILAQRLVKTLCPDCKKVMPKR
jgi:type II secretory ATPase GspE/PulE/Tfp pilus assembly ATPase PilB-like protein